jgi:hypothetical protein
VCCFVINRNSFFRPEKKVRVGLGFEDNVGGEVRLVQTACSDEEKSGHVGLTG